MSIDKFVTEIQNRKKNDLAELDKKLSDKKSEIDTKKKFYSKRAQGELC